MSHTSRLEKDLAALRFLYESHRGQDSTFDTELLSTIGRCVTNLGRCRKSEEEYLTADQVIEVQRSYRDKLVAASGRDDWPSGEYEKPSSADYNIQLATLDDLRAQLTDACEADELSAARIRKIITPIIRGEIQLWQTAIDAKNYLRRDDIEKEIEAFNRSMIEFSRENIPYEEWEKIIDVICEVQEC